MLAYGTNKLKQNRCGLLRSGFERNSDGEPGALINLTVDTNLTMEYVNLGFHQVEAKSFAFYVIMKALIHAK